jgi:predicted MFS family arabinose efflux permease
VAATGKAPLQGNRDFVRFWSADVISTLGSHLSAIAFPLLVLSLGGSAAQAGLLASFSLIARLVFRLPGGHMADHWDRRWLMLGADLIRLVALASVSLTATFGDPSFAQLLVVAVVEGIATAIFGPAASVAVRDVVPRAEVAVALSRVQSASSTAMLVGPPLGGLLFSIGPILPFTLDAMSYAISAALLLRITVTPPPRLPADQRDHSVTAGMRWLAGQPSLLWVLLFATVLNLTATSAQVGVVLTLRGQAESGTVIGLVMACAGVGAVAGSVAAPRVNARLRPGLLFLTVGVIWGSGFLLFATTPPPVFVGATLVLMMISTPATGIVLGEAILTNAPRHLLGRVNTAVGTGTAGLAALGPLLVGAALQSVGVAMTWSILAAAVVLVSVVTAVPLFRMATLVSTHEPLGLPAQAADIPAVEV